MDRVRLGRALGYGTRHAAKTLAAVAQAATAPDPVRPAASTPVASAPQRDRPVYPPPAARDRKRPSVAQVRGASKSFWGPLATFSSALWLRVTGTFFGLIALAMANGAWRLRGALRSGVSGSVEARHLWVFLVFALLFGYFAVSGFLRASVRERQGSARATR